MMYDLYFWITYFAPPLFLLALTAFVFRPSARRHYEAAKRVIFSERELARQERNSVSPGNKRAP